MKKAEWKWPQQKVNYSSVSQKVYLTSSISVEISKGYFISPEVKHHSSTSCRDKFELSAWSRSSECILMLGREGSLHRNNRVIMLCCYLEGLLLLWINMGDNALRVWARSWLQILQVWCCDLSACFCSRLMMWAAGHITIWPFGWQSLQRIRETSPTLLIIALMETCWLIWPHASLSRSERSLAEARVYHLSLSAQQGDR